MTFPLKEGAGVSTLSFSTGLTDGEPCLIWQLEARAMGACAPGMGSVLPWVDEAHATVLGWFRTLARGEMLESMGLA